MAALDTLSILETLGDDEEYDLTASRAGFGRVQAGNNEEWAQFQFTTAAVVTLLNETANVNNADVDTDLCIYDGGANTVKIKNRLGAEKKVAIFVKYFTP